MVSSAASSTISRSLIRSIPDYPKPGVIILRDITTLSANPRAFRTAWTNSSALGASKVDRVAGIEARGFILGGAVAHQPSAGFVPIRKKGKLPHGPSPSHIRWNTASMRSRSSRTPWRGDRVGSLSTI